MLSWCFHYQNKYSSLNYVLSHGRGGFEGTTRTIWGLQCSSYANQWKVDKSIHVILRRKWNDFRALAWNDYSKFTKSLTTVGYFNSNNKIPQKLAHETHLNVLLSAVLFPHSLMSISHCFLNVKFNDGALEILWVFCFHSY